MAVALSSRQPDIKQASKSTLHAMTPGFYSALRADFSADLDSNFKSSLFGLHFSQDFPALCAATQHLCVQVLLSALAFSQQVLPPFSAPRAFVIMSEAMQTRALKVFIGSHHFTKDARHQLI
jgi:hypothetical protein